MAVEEQAPLRRIHRDETIMSGASRFSFDHWSKRGTSEIIESLRPGKSESLKVKSDGRILNGNVCVKVLEDRGYDINSLAREVI